MGTAVLTVSSKGQIVLPADVRREMSIESGDKLAVFSADGVIMLKPIKLPTADEFRAELDRAQNWANSVGLTEEDVENAIKDVRASKKR